MEGAHHVTVRLARNYEFVADFNDVPGSPSILFDEPPPLGGGHAPNAAAVLGAAVGNCLAASLAFCLRKSRFDVKGLTANVTTHVARDEKGRFRISGIDVEFAPDLNGRRVFSPAHPDTTGPGRGDGPRFERCEQLFEDFCTVTASVRRGIPISVSLRPAGDAA
jgi:uncharacterized OsmC-like protein